MVAFRFLVALTTALSSLVAGQSASTVPTPKLQLKFTLRAYLDGKDATSEGPFKSANGPAQAVTPLSKGFLRGSGLNATILPGGADVELVSNMAL
jgi:hypothetical protein